MARPINPRGAGIIYRGVQIRLYPRSDGWKATFKLHGQERRECYRPTQAAAQQAAQDAIAKELDPYLASAGRDEETARKLLADHGVSLTEAARYWLWKHEKPLIEATVEDLRARWLAVREKNAGYHHAKALRSRTFHFEEKFHGRKIASITQEELIEWQDILDTKFEGRTVRNIHDATKMLFKYARKRGFLDGDRLSPMENVDRPTARAGKKGIFTPEQMQALFDAAWALASPAAAAMAIAAYTAIRSEELYSVDPDKSDEDQINWEDFRWKEKFIYVREEVSKLHRARNVPMPERLIKMLLPLKSKGPVYTKTRLDLAYARIARRAGVEWKHNALRHSAITYDMLLSPSPAEVANRAGNSIAVIESSLLRQGHLRAVVAWHATSQPQANYSWKGQASAGLACSRLPYRQSSPNTQHPR